MNHSLWKHCFLDWIVWVHVYTNNPGISLLFNWKAISLPFTKVPCQLVQSFNLFDYLCIVCNLHCFKHHWPYDQKTLVPIICNKTWHVFFTEFIQWVLWDLIFILCVCQCFYTISKKWSKCTFLHICRWRVVVYSGIDGFSRLILYLTAATNNKAQTVLDSFQSAVEQYGIPPRVRLEKGGENILVARFMMTSQGVNRNSHIAGRSAHNQRYLTLQ